MSEAHDIELLYEVWEQNIETLRVLHRSTNERPGIVPTMVSHLRACAVDLVKRASNGSAHPFPRGTAAPARRSTRAFSPSASRNGSAAKSISALSPSSLVSICGRSPSHAHHVRYAQPRGLRLKVSDEFTVPLCAIHHSENHTTGDERRWWQERNLDPLPVAHRLWQNSRSTHRTQMWRTRLNLMRKSLSPVKGEKPYPTRSNSATFP